MTQKYSAKWKDLECSMITDDIPLQAIIADSKRLESIDKLGNIWVECALAVWKEHIKTYKLDKVIKVLSWIAYDKNFKPNHVDPRFKDWNSRGLNAFFQIVKDNHVESFETLKDKFNLQKDDFYKQGTITIKKSNTICF